jgi:hypothetical protein
MNTADAREELESAIWRTDPASLSAVRAVMAAAERYATAVTAETLDRIDRDRRTAARRDHIIASRRAALIEDDGKHYGETG